MAKILIVTNPGDYHAIAVHWGLKRLGSEVSLWMPTDLPDQASLSIHLSNDETPRVSLTSQNIRNLVSEADVVWNRRRRRPVAPAHASPHDVAAIEMESWEHVNSTIWLLSNIARVVNDPTRQSAADRKSLQLKIASEIGFRIPRTLFSNDFEEVKSFQQAVGQVIVKSHKPHLWLTDTAWYTQVTQILPQLEQQDRDSVELCPIILQERIEAAREVRLFLCGTNFFAAGITRGSVSNSVDGRVEMSNPASSFEELEIPSEVRTGCLQYFGRFGLEMGAFDFLVDKDGRWTFLECNEAGQFLFIERKLPSLKILDTFCRWLVELAGETPANHGTLTTAEFEQSSDAEQISEAHRSHKRLDMNDFSVRETSAAA